MGGPSEVHDKVGLLSPLVQGRPDATTSVDQLGMQSSDIPTGEISRAESSRNPHEVVAEEEPEVRTAQLGGVCCGDDGGRLPSNPVAGPLAELKA